ncbi:hypothetical protein CN617_28155 [Bacillus wiedmannii]|nr:hypothetical protein CN617_28155 [Bacillus wiedmannii]
MSAFSLFIINKGDCDMKIILLETERKKKEKLMVTIPIIELMYGEKGEIEFKVVGKKVVPQSMFKN